MRELQAAAERARAGREGPTRDDLATADRVDEATSGRRSPATGAPDLLPGIGDGASGAEVERPTDRSLTREEAARRRAEIARASEERAARREPLERASPELHEALPPDLRDRLPIFVDPDFPANSVHVSYDVDIHGVISNVHMVIGPTAGAADIGTHVRTARAVERYTGLSGRLRSLLERFRLWAFDHGQPPVGSRAWEARLEVEKLPRSSRSASTPSCAAT